MPISIVLRFHLGEEPNEFGRLADTVQKGIAGVARIQVKTADGGFSQPPDGFGTLAFQRVDAGDIVGRVMVERILERMPARMIGICASAA